MKDALHTLARSGDSRLVIDICFDEVHRLKAEQVLPFAGGEVVNTTHLLTLSLTFRRSRRQYSVNFLSSLPTGRPVLERQVGQAS